MENIQDPKLKHTTMYSKIKECYETGRNTEWSCIGKGTVIFNRYMFGPYITIKAKYMHENCTDIYSELTIYEERIHNSVVEQVIYDYSNFYNPKEKTITLEDIIRYACKLLWPDALIIKDIEARC